MLVLGNALGFSKFRLCARRRRFNAEDDPKSARPKRERILSRRSSERMRLAEIRFSGEAEMWHEGR
jgi:hypothetical protein